METREVAKKSSKHIAQSQDIKLFLEVSVRVKCPYRDLEASLGKNSGSEATDVEMCPT